MLFKGADHRFSQANLSAYIDGRLTTRERSRLERHLASCRDCTADLESLRQTKALLGQLPQMMAPRSFKLPASLQAEYIRYRRLSRTYRLLGSASAVAAVLLVVLLAGGTILGYLGGARSAAPQTFGYQEAPADSAVSSEVTVFPAATAYPAPAGGTQGSAEVAVEAYPEQPAAEMATAMPENEPTGQMPAKMGSSGEGTPIATEETAAARSTYAEEGTPTSEVEQAIQGSADVTAAANAYPEAPTSGKAVPEVNQGTSVPTTEIAVALVGNPEATSEPAQPVSASESTPEPESASRGAGGLTTIWRDVVIALAVALALLMGGWGWAAYRRSH